MQLQTETVLGLTPGLVNPLLGCIVLKGGVFGFDRLEEFLPDPGHALKLVLSCCLSISTRNEHQV